MIQSQTATVGPSDLLLPGCVCQSARGPAAGDYPCSSLRLFILASASGCSQVSDVSHTQVTRYSAHQKPCTRTNLFNILGNQHTFYVT